MGELPTADQDWPYQRNARDYLRKLMVEHYGLNVDRPELNDELWQQGYIPPIPITAKEISEHKYRYQPNKTILKAKK